MVCTSTAMWQNLLQRTTQNETAALFLPNEKLRRERKMRWACSEQVTEGWKQADSALAMWSRSLSQLPPSSSFCRLYNPFSTAVHSSCSLCFLSFYNIFFPLIQYGLLRKTKPETLHFIKKKKKLTRNVDGDMRSKDFAIFTWAVIFRKVGSDV